MDSTPDSTNGTNLVITVGGEKRTDDDVSAGTGGTNAAAVSGLHVISPHIHNINSYPQKHRVRGHRATSIAQRPTKTSPTTSTSRNVTVDGKAAHQLFLQAIEEESIPCEMKQDQVAPLCLCCDPCELRLTVPPGSTSTTRENGRQSNFEHGNFERPSNFDQEQLWVCKARKCMYYRVQHELRVGDRVMVDVKSYLDVHSELDTDKRDVLAFCNGAQATVDYFLENGDVKLQAVRVEDFAINKETWPAAMLTRIESAGLRTPSNRLTVPSPASENLSISFCYSYSSFNSMGHLSSLLGDQTPSPGTTNLAVALAAAVPSATTTSAMSSAGNSSDVAVKCSTRDPTEFWKFFADLILSPNEESAHFLNSFITTIPNCKCGKRTQLVVCSNSGDLFWACKTRECTYLHFSEERPKAVDLDVGQFSMLGHKDIDRYTTVWCLMHRYGSTVMNHAFFQSLFVPPTTGRLEMSNNSTMPQKFISSPKSLAAPTQFFSAACFCVFLVIVCVFSKNVLRFGRSFSTSFWHKLWSSGRNSDFPEGSYKLKPGQHYDLFFSYRGGTGRGWLWLTLVGQWNRRAAFAWVFVVCPVIVIILVFSVSDPCAQGVPLMLLGPLHCTTADMLIQNFKTMGQFIPPYDGGVANFHIFTHYPFTWFVFVPYAPLVLALTYIFWQPQAQAVWEWFFEPYRIFFDKYCVHQGDPTRTGEGLMRLCLYLKSSKAIICLFDHEYVDRLWCIFELAVYLRLVKKHDVAFVSISQRSVEVIGVLSVNLSLIVIGWGAYIQVNDSIQDGEQDAETEYGGFLPRYWFVHSVLINTVIFILAQQHFRALDKLKKSVKSFDVSKCKLAVEDDRELLVGFIDELFIPSDQQSPATEDRASPSTGAGSSPTVGAGLVIFNKAVRRLIKTQLPLSGPRSWKIFSYIPAVLIAASGNMLVAYDYHAYDMQKDYWDSPWYAFRDVAGFLTWKPFVLFPLYVYLQSCIIRFAWWFQSHLCRCTGWRYQYGMIVGWVFYITIDVVFPFRKILTQNLNYICINHAISGFDDGFMRVTFAPFTNLAGLWSSGSIFLPEWSYWITEVSTNWWIDIMIWVFLIIPITLFVFYIYEPQITRKLRAKLLAKLFPKKFTDQPDTVTAVTRASNSTAVPSTTITQVLHGVGATEAKFPSDDRDKLSDLSDDSAIYPKTSENILYPQQPYTSIRKRRSEQFKEKSFVSSRLSSQTIEGVIASESTIPRGESRKSKESIDWQINY